MTRDTQRTLALLQNAVSTTSEDAVDFKGWLALDLEELGSQVVVELKQI